MVSMRRGNGEGSICKRPDGTWRGMLTTGYDQNGKRKRREVVGRTKAAVIEKIAQLRSDNLAGALPDPQRLTVAQYLRRWLENDVRPNNAAGTYDNYERAVRLHINPHFGGVQVASLQAFHVKDLYGALARENASIHTREMVAKTLRRALGEAHRVNLIRVNHCLAVKKPVAKQGEMRVLSMAEVRRFLDRVKGDRLEALFVLALTSGMREGELFALQWGDIDFKARAVHIQRSVDQGRGLKGPKTYSSRRRVDLPESTMGALREHRKRMLAEGHPGPLVFCDAAGKLLNRSNFVTRDFHRTLVKAGLAEAKTKKKPGRKKKGEEVQQTEAKEAVKVIVGGRLPDKLPRVRFHDLRHTHASLLLAQGVNIKAIQERLGHARVELTLRLYAHLMPGAQRQVADELEMAIFAKASVANQRSEIV